MAVGELDFFDIFEDLALVVDSPEGTPEESIAEFRRLARELDQAAVALTVDEFNENYEDEDNEGH